MKVSVVIPTYNRTEDLGACLDSILAQILMPYEIFVIDNASNNNTENLIGRRKENFIKEQCLLNYIPNPKNSLSVARNLGAKQTSGDIVIFLDDDVILGNEYVSEICKVYKEYPEALGVQGYIVPDHFRLNVRDFFYKIFYLYHLEHNGCRALPSVSTTYPIALDRVMKCEWLSGANHSYRRRVLEEFNHDENLMKYSEGEDLEFSHRVYSRYPGTLFITPLAMLQHNASASGRTLGKELIYMQEIYALYLFFKVFGSSFRNNRIYIWSRIGRIIIMIIQSIKNRATDHFIELRYLLEAYSLCIKRFRDIKRGNLEFFSNTLK
jgi:glycosyltransferase involved in cell wall biosynthesis